MDIEGFFRPILAILDINAAFNPRVVALIALLTFLGEANIQVPLLLEAIWLLIGYQFHPGISHSTINLLVTLCAASAGRQIGISSIYFIYRAFNNPLSRFFMKRIQNRKFYKKYKENESWLSTKFFSLSSATIGMLTPLNFAIKILLVLKRKLRVLLLGTLVSGVWFDAIYIAFGAIFHSTTLELTYFPLFLLLGFGFFILLRIKVFR